MASSQPDLEKMKLRKSYGNMWHSDLMRAVLADGPYFCFALRCGPCASYTLRKRALHDDMSRYECCAGYLPCCGQCMESDCPELCLCTEAFISWLHQLSCFFSIVACITCNSHVRRVSQYLHLVAHLAYCGVCACMQTQHKIELDKRDGNLGESAMSVPPKIRMSRLDRPIPPSLSRPPTEFENPFAS